MTIDSFVSEKKVPGLFEGTAWYYSRFRPGYPAEAIDFLVQKVELNCRTPILDLGAGTGQIAIPMALRRVPVTAVDPDIDMLCEGLRAEKRAEVSGILWMRGDDKMLPDLNIGQVKLCTMGASFHWTDRDTLLHALDFLVVADGAVAVLSGGASVWSDREEGWPAIAKAVVVEMLGIERRAGGGTYSHPKDRHEKVLKRSPFSKVETFEFAVDTEIAVDDIIGLQLSTSYASPSQLGNRIDEFKSILRKRLLEANPSGVFKGTQTTELLLARR